MTILVFYRGPQIWLFQTTETCHFEVVEARSPSRASGAVHSKGYGGELVSSNLGAPSSPVSASLPSKPPSLPSLFPGFLRPIPPLPQLLSNQPPKQGQGWAHLLSEHSSTYKYDFRSGRKNFPVYIWGVGPLAGDYWLILGDGSEKGEELVGGKLWGGN